MGNLQGRVALVTGGASGLGNAISRRLADDGATVVISDVQAELGSEVASKFGFSFVTHDVTDEQQWQSVVASVVDRHGGLHILVNNAGILGSMRNADPVSTSLVDWRRTFAVNVDGVFLGCRTAIPAIHESGGGSIVNISSVAGLLATPYATAYGASKAAVRQLTKSVAQHCAEVGLRVRCNSIHPGDVVTPLWMGRAEEQAQDRGVTAQVIIDEAAAMYPLGRLSEPSDIAAAAAFLVSDDARQITGSMLVVDGGLVECETFGLAVGRDSSSSRIKREPVNDTSRRAK